MFPAYVENPTNCRFEGQDNDENIILLLRAHPITNLPWIIFAIILFFIPFLIPRIISSLGLPFQLPSSIITPLIIIDYLLVVAIIFEGYLNWYFNVNIITDKRIVDIDFHSILLKMLILPHSPVFRKLQDQ